MSQATSSTKIEADRRLEYPEGAVGGGVLWPYALGIGGYHLAALAALHPWFYSHVGAVLFFLGLYVYGTLGINLCYHRLLTHQGLRLPKWLEYLFALFGVCCLEDTPARWVAIHRMHHLHSDERPDPHSPLVTLFWGHMGWLFVNNRNVSSAASYERFARDILKDRFYLMLERNLAWVWINAAQWVLYFAAGYATGLGMGHGSSVALQWGASWLVWGVILRTVAVWHITWSVNSLSHLWGYRNYETSDLSRNNWFVALVANGEGWHNNHHADQCSAAHGHRWWEFDVTWQTIRALELVGIARDVVRPKNERKSREPEQITSEATPVAPVESHPEPQTSA